MSHTYTSTYVEMKVTASTYMEILGCLEDAGYLHAIHEDGTLDLDGIALVPELPADLRDPKTVLERGRALLKKWVVGR